MFKITVLLFLFVLLAVGAIWLIKPKLPFFQNPLIKSENLTNIKDQQSVLSETYNNLFNTTKKAAEDVKDNVYQNSKKTLDNLFDKKTEL